MLTTGDKSIDFQLQDQAGITHQLSDYRGQWVLLYFYPKDGTPGCTTEACSIRDVWSEYSAKGVKVLGISADSVDSHKKFAQKHQLPFPLLSDTDKKVLELYGAFGKKNIFGKTALGIKRISYLINPDGMIAKVYPKVKPDQHADEVLQDIDQLQSS